MMIGRERVTSNDSASKLPVHPETQPSDALTRDFLDWLARSPRTYAEAMEAWRTSCPRLSIWEDALADGFIRVESEPGKPIDQAVVRLTVRGQAVLDVDSSSAGPKREFFV